VFLSLFGSFTQLAHPPFIVALQDPPVYRGKLPSFNLFTVFSPPTTGGCNHGLLFTFIIPLWLRFPSCPGFSEGVTLWL